ncbi:MAG: hypothetical protein U0840_09955 [Gemmataceae bacterium]
MSAAGLCQTLWTQWEALCQLVWPASPHQRTQLELQRIETDLDQLHTRLVERQRRIIRLQDLIQRLEHRSAQRVAHPEAAVHTALRRNRLRLQAHQQRYTAQQRRFVRLRRLQKALARGEVVVAPDPS